MKSFDKEKKEEAFLSVYDAFLSVEGENCEIAHDNFKEFREKASNYKGVQIGVKAPNFEIEAQTGNYLYKLKSDYILLIFWATWCPHCKEELLKIQKLLDKNLVKLEKDGFTWKTIAISLDTDENQWRNFIAANNLTNWQHISELNSWNDTTVKKYNIYATPTMFLLDKDKIIIKKPTSARALELFFEEKK